MKIAIASDHAGYRLKEVLKAHLEKAGYVVSDYGTDSEEPVDYPDYVRPAARSVVDCRNDRGIVLGGSGNGEAMVANKVKGIRCAVCWSVEGARLAKEHNDANVISIGARLVSESLAIEIVDTWLQAEFQAGRHVRRIQKIERGRRDCGPDGSLGVSGLGT
jgi:ribose 5-phosphate isomerase B